MKTAMLAFPGTFSASPEQLTALLDAILSVSGDLTLSETLKRVVVAAGKLTNARYAALGVPDESGAFLAEFVTSGLSAEAEARIGHRPRGHGLLGLILREGQTLRLRDLSQHPRSYGFPPNHPPMKSFLGTSIMHKGRSLGNLYLTDKQGAEEFSDDDERLIEMLATHAGLAIANAQLFTEVQKLRVVEERQRIGMDLHDGIIQSIYAVGLTLEYVDGLMLDADIEGARERLRTAVESLNATIRDIRAYILDLRPRRFEGSNLVAGLHALLAEFKANTLIAVEFNTSSEVDDALWPEARMALFHIAQEALSNAAKHSRASRVQVSLLAEDGEIKLSVSDNGQGFNSARVEHRAGHGLNNIQDRALALGGRMNLHSPPGQGTTLQIIIPRRLRATTG
jgi:signal transduction histidine kinase